MLNERRETRLMFNGDAVLGLPSEKTHGSNSGREAVLRVWEDQHILAADNAALFDSLKELLPDEPGSPSQAEIAAHLGMNENAVRQAFYRFRQRYQSLLREEIAHTVATPGDIEDELRHLIAVLEA